MDTDTNTHSRDDATWLYVQLNCHTSLLTCSSLKDTKSSMEVNWLNTMALAEGSACSILCTSSLRASILVLDWKSEALILLRMLLLRLLNAFTGDCNATWITWYT